MIYLVNHWVLHSFERITALDFLRSGKCHLCVCGWLWWRSQENEDVSCRRICSWLKHQGEWKTTAVQPVKCQLQFFSPQPALWKFHKHPVSLGGWLRWQEEEFCLRPGEETNAITPKFRPKSQFRWVKRAETTILAEVPTSLWREGQGYNG